MPLNWKTVLIILQNFEIFLTSDILQYIQKAVFFIRKAYLKKKWHCISHSKAIFRRSWFLERGCKILGEDLYLCTFLKGTSINHVVNWRGSKKYPKIYLRCLWMTMTLNDHYEKWYLRCNRAKYQHWIIQL